MIVWREPAGEPVPSDHCCAFCGRSPRPDERYGHHEEDWDKPGRICPQCWDATTLFAEEADTASEQTKED